MHVDNVFDAFRADAREAIATRLLEKWRRIAGRRQWPQHLVDDAAGDAFVRILTCRQPPAPDKLDAWANAIFVNCMFDAIKLEARVRRMPSFDDDRSGPPLDPGLTPEDQLLLAVTAAAARTAFAGLSWRERVAWRFGRREASAAAVASLLGVSPGRVRHIAMATRRHLWQAVAPGRRRPVLRAERSGRRSRPRPAVPVTSAPLVEPEKSARACNTGAASDTCSVKDGAPGAAIDMQLSADNLAAFNGKAIGNGGAHEASAARSWSVPGRQMAAAVTR